MRRDEHGQGIVLAEIFLVDCVDSPDKVLSGNYGFVADQIGEAVGFVSFLSVREVSYGLVHGMGAGWWLEGGVFLFLVADFELLFHPKMENSPLLHYSPKMR